MQHGQGGHPHQESLLESLCDGAARAGAEVEDSEAGHEREVGVELVTQDLRHLPLNAQHRKPYMPHSYLIKQKTAFVGENCDLRKLDNAIENSGENAVVRGAGPAGLHCVVEQHQKY